MSAVYELESLEFCYLEQRSVSINRFYWLERERENREIWAVHLARSRREET